MNNTNQALSSSAMTKTIIFGASGFIGQHLLQEVAPDKSFLVTRVPGEITSIDQSIRHWVEADLLKPPSIERVLSSGATVINLAYSQSSSAEDNIKMAENLVQACLRTNVSRLVHCSTAVVVGDNSCSIVDEETACFPTTMYEKTKCKIERVFLDTADKLNVYLLRPTVVIGPGGRNLKKMLSDIKNGNVATNLIRSSIYGERKLNLVPVRDVVRALLYLSERDFLPSGIYICSADDDPNNRYDCVEELMRKLLMKPLRIKPVNLPNQFLNALLYVSRSGSGRFANRSYSSKKLFQSGFQRSSSVLQAVSEFVLSEQCSDTN